MILVYLRMAVAWVRWCAKNRGALVLSFGAGVIISSFCPANILLILLAIALVLLGIAYLKC